MSNKTLQLNIEIVENKDEWKLLLDKLKTSNTYMKWSWGSYKIMNGWDVKRLQIIDSKSKQLLACCQIQSKRKLFINIYLMAFQIPDLNFLLFLWGKKLTVS